MQTDAPCGDERWFSVTGQKTPLGCGPKPKRKRNRLRGPAFCAGTDAKGSALTGGDRRPPLHPARRIVTRKAQTALPLLAAIGPARWAKRIEPGPTQPVDLE